MRKIGRKTTSTTIYTKKTKSGFWSSKDIRALNLFYNVIVGGRANGKSQELKKVCLKEAWEENRNFSLIFRREKLVSQINGYFSDVVKREDGEEYIKDLTGGKCDDIIVKAGHIFLTKEGKKVKEVGRVLFLEKYIEYKSEAFTDIYNLIFEEFITEDGSYLVNEPEKFDSLRSTVFRLRPKEKVHIYLIGNAVSAITPYTSEWGLEMLARQEQGTIDIYDREFINEKTGEPEIIKVACEMTYPRPESMSLSKKGRQSEVGKWEHSEKPKMTIEELNKCMLQYEFVVTYGGFYFLLRLYTHPSNNIFLYCEKKTTEIKEGTRVIGDVFSLSNKYTRTFIPLFEREKIVFNLIKEKKIYFCDDLTGENFYTAVQNINLMR